MPVKYNNNNFDIKKLSVYNIDRKAIEGVPPDTLVLDIGCATGFMGEYLIKKKNCKVIGVDLREDEIKIAKKKLSGALLGDIESDTIVPKILSLSKNKKFDVILATSLIEHLKNPEMMLDNVKKLLQPKGLFIVTTPNIAHWSMRVALFKGDFDYSEYGILDNTHLKFFTIKSFKDIFKKKGFKIRELLIDPEGGGYPRISIFMSKFFPGLFAYQILIVAKISK